MDGSSNTDNNSFIPKRGPVRNRRRGASRQVYIFTITAYILFSATLVGAAGVFLYGNYIDEQLSNEVQALNTEIDRFREADLDEVRSFDARLRYVENRVQNQTNLETFFSALEEATANTVQMQTLTLLRQDDSGYLATAEVQTDTFDSSIFQREFLEQDGVIKSVTISELEVVTSSGEQTEEGGVVNFVASMGVPLTAIPFIPGSSRPAVAETATTTASTTTTANQDSITTTTDLPDIINQTEL